jgi:hypothetical protein
MVQGNSILKIIDTAKNNGYKLNLIYVSVDSVETAIERVANRVRNNGYDIPTETILKRYPESLQNLNGQIHKFDDVEIIDNTKAFETVFQALDRDIVFVSEDLPEWVKTAIKAFKNHLGNDTKHDFEISEKDKIESLFADEQELLNEILNMSPEELSNLPHPIEIETPSQCGSPNDTTFQDSKNIEESAGIEKSSKSVVETDVPHDCTPSFLKKDPSKETMLDTGLYVADNFDDYDDPFTK